MKNCIKTSFIIGYFLFNGSFCDGQRIWKAQSCSTCCWAAATQNVFSGMGLTTNECELLQAIIVTSSTTPRVNCVAPVGTFGIDKRGFIGLTKKFASFSYLNNTDKTLSWNAIKNTVKPTPLKPFIASFDNNTAQNHFVNVYGTLVVASKQWLYVFDPFLTNKGLHYLKNYQTYQLPGKSSGIQCSYWGFGNKKLHSTDVFYRADKITGANSILDVYVDTGKIKNTIGAILGANRSVLGPENVTGLKVGDALIPIDMASMIPLSRVETASSSNANSARMLAEITVVQRQSDCFIIPIFKDSGNVLIFKSMILLLRDLNNINLYVVDRIQKLNVPISLQKTEVVMVDNNIHLPPGLLPKFIQQDDGTLNIQIRDKIFDVTFNNQSPFTESKFYGKILKKDPTETYINREINATILEKSTQNFREELINKGFQIRGDSIMVNGKNETIDNFKAQLRRIPTFQKIIILDKQE